MTLDVEKAFDQVHHTALFEALLNIGVETYAVTTLRKLYYDSSAYVALQQGATSRCFSVQRGVRQGDPLSPLLFNLVLDGVLKEASAIWRRRGYGTNVGQEIGGSRLTHVAFADDQTLLSRSWLSMKRMILSLKTALAHRGLSLHPLKCQV